MLAALHYNENADREQAVNKHGDKIFKIRFPKYKKGGFSVCPVKTDPTHGMLQSAMVNNQWFMLHDQNCKSICTLKTLACIY
jgi:hypothetical protein